MFVGGRNNWTDQPFDVRGLEGLAGAFGPALPGAKLFGRSAGAAPPPPVAPTSVSRLPSIPTAVFGGKKATPGPTVLPAWMTSKDPSSAGFYNKKSIFLNPQAASPGAWGAGSVLRSMQAALRPAGPAVDETKAAASSLLFGGPKKFGSALSIPQATSAAPSPAVIQAAQQVAAVTPAVTPSPQNYTGTGGGGGGGGSGDYGMPADETLPAEVAAPVGWWAGLSTVAKVGVVAGGAGAAFAAYKMFKRGGRSVGHKS